MFTLKVFHVDGGYTAVACKAYSILAPFPADRGLTWVKTHSLTQGEDETFAVETKIIIENANGKTIDVLRAGRVDG